jgi:hypothetical protein
LALAPCSTASTRAIESFQRNPNGGTNSSAARACSAEKIKEAIRPIQKNWRISWFERVTHIETRQVVSVSVACIYNLLGVRPPPAEAENCAHRLCRSTRDPQTISSEVCSLRRFRIRRGWLARIFSTHCFLVFARTRVLDFLSQENFFFQLKIKFIFFLSLSQLISTLKPAGEDNHKARVNKL